MLEKGRALGPSLFSGAHHSGCHLEPRHLKTRKCLWLYPSPILLLLFSVDVN